MLVSQLFSGLNISCLCETSGLAGNTWNQIPEINYLFKLSHSWNNSKAASAERGAALKNTKARASLRLFVSYPLCGLSSGFIWQKSCLCHGNVVSVAVPSSFFCRHGLGNARVACRPGIYYFWFNRSTGLLVMLRCPVNFQLTLWFQETSRDLYITLEKIDLAFREKNRRWESSMGSFLVTYVLVLNFGFLISLFFPPLKWGSAQDFWPSCLSLSISCGHDMLNAVFLFFQLI